MISVTHQHPIPYIKGFREVLNKKIAFNASLA
jgi:hypothetical protein